MPARYVIAASGGFMTLLGVAFTLIDSNLFASAVLFVGLGMSAGGMWPEISPSLADAARASIPVCRWILESVSEIRRRISVAQIRTTGSHGQSVEAIDDATFDAGEKARLKKRRRAIRAGVRFLVMKQANYSCQICGVSRRRDQSVELHVDHKIPLAKGGTNEVSNLWVLCSTCNLGKGIKSL